jgi:UDP-glucose 4-epimerase
LISQDLPDVSNRFKATPRRAGDPTQVYADPRYAEDTLGWKARFGLEDIISTAWAWHSTHVDGYA